MTGPVQVTGWVFEDPRDSDPTAVYVEGIAAQAAPASDSAGFKYLELQAVQGMAAGWASGTLLDVADAKRVLARTLTQIGAYEEAIDHVCEAMTSYAEAGWQVGMSSGLCIQGEAMVAQGRYEQASECLFQALGMGRETHTIQALVRARIGLGRLL